MAETTFNFAGKEVSIKGYSQNDWIYTSIKNNSTFYEIDLLKYMKYALKNKEGYLLDVGANIGNHTVFFGAILERNVVCIEPNPPIFSILEQNSKTNRISYEALNIGLGAKKGQFSIDADHDAAQGNIGAAKLYETSQGTIQVERLDDIIESFKFSNEKLIAIKADIEGMEAEMLKGALKTLALHKPDVFLEINDENQMYEIEGLLYPVGYKKLYAYAGTPVWHFAHVSQLTLNRRVKLYVYDLFIRFKQFVGQILRKVKIK